METSDLDYTLPEDLIAQHPAEPRDAARLMVLDRADRSIHLDVYRNVSAYLRAGDCMALNDTRVIRARLRARKTTGGQIELFLLREQAPCEWVALVRPSARVKPGAKVILAGGLEAEVLEPVDGGGRLVRFNRPDVMQALETAGEVPLPPYVHRDKPDERDGERYQTIYAARPGAVAAPTAGLHFTDGVLDSLDRAHVRRAYLTLHVGYGTFRPIQTDRVEEHVLEPEEYELSQETANALNETRVRGGRVIAVGTTCTRVLETQFHNGAYQPGSGHTARFIYPPYTFQAVDILQTNFHLPRSSLLALVCAFAGRDFVLEAYARAIRERFRFYSYGDVMVIR